MNYADIKTNDIANGPGIRVSIFVAGCRLCCPGCFNPELQRFDFGKQLDHDAITSIIEAVRDPYIDGLSILGGEPMDPHNVEYTWSLVARVREAVPDTSIWVYTGYTLEMLLTRWQSVYKNYSMLECMSTFNILKNSDILVDGPFEEDQKNLGLRFCGSANQRVIDLKQSTIIYPETVNDLAYIQELVERDEYKWKKKIEDQ